MLDEATRPAPGKLEIRVYYEDTDFSGRVYHASYLRFLERGRTELLRACGLSHGALAEAEGIAFVVRSMTIDFLKPARIDDLLVVETSTEAPRGASLTFRQRILIATTPIVEATVLAAVIRGEKPARLPPGLREALGGPRV